MDDRTFDRWTRNLSDLLTRRGLGGKAAAGITLAIFGVASDVGLTEAGKRKRKKKKRRKKKRKRNQRCVPQCAGKSCGSDGCGGECGVCGANQVCWNGACEPCVPAGSNPGEHVGGGCMAGRCCSRVCTFDAVCGRRCILRPNEPCTTDCECGPPDRGDRCVNGVCVHV